MRIDIQNLDFINDKLRALAVDLESSTGIELIITSLYRLDDKGVHGQLPLRGIDTRCRDSAIGRALEAHVNSRWKYDFNREHVQCAIFHDTGLGPHLHLQVHPNTRRV